MSTNVWTSLERGYVTEGSAMFVLAFRWRSTTATRLFLEAIRTRIEMVYEVSTSVVQDNLTPSAVQSHIHSPKSPIPFMCFKDSSDRLVPECRRRSAQENAACSLRLRVPPDDHSCLPLKVATEGATERRLSTADCICTISSRSTV